MGKKVVVEGCTLKGSHEDTITILPTSVLSQKAKCGGKKIYQTIIFTSKAGTYNGGGTLGGASQKATGNNLPFVLEDAKVTITLTNTPPATDTKSSDITVADCGQTKVKVL